MRKLINLYKSSLLIVALCALSSCQTPDQNLSLENSDVENLTDMPSQSSALPEISEVQSEPTMQPEPPSSPESLNEDANTASPSEKTDYFQLMLDELGIQREEIPAFQLTEAEQKLYDQYIQDGNLSILNNQEPVTVAKIYIQCGIDSKRDREFALYYPPSLSMTKEEYLLLNNPYASSHEDLVSYAGLFFHEIDQSVFEQEAENRGYLSFKTYFDEDVKFYLYKNEEGTWMPRFSPM